MKIQFSNIEKIKALRKANREAEISSNLMGRTKSKVYKNKKIYDRKSNKFNLN